jgi:hypothetical protein
MVSGVAKNGSAITGNQLIPDAAQLAAIVAAQKANNTGRYPLIFRALDDTSVTLIVTLYDGSSSVPAQNAPNKSMVMGNNFTYNVASALLDANTVKTISGAYGTNNAGFPIGTGSISINASDLSKIIAAQSAGTTGQYKAELSTAFGAYHNITVTLVKDPAPAVVPSTPVTPGGNTTNNTTNNTTRNTRNVTYITNNNPTRTTTIPTYTPAPVPAVTNVTNTPAPDQPVQTVVAPVTPESSIGEQETPMANRQPANVSTWALVNLLLAIAGIALFIAMFIILPKRRREEDERKHTPVWLTLSCIAAAAGALLFILTQDISAKAVMIDRYTIMQAGIFALGFVVAIVSATSNRRGDEEDEMDDMNYKEAYGK